jgi:four helix bundle suffix protein
MPANYSKVDRAKLIPTHGGYRNLKSFQVAQLAYDVTVRFCNRYIGKHTRTHDQTVQAARSGVQNIAGSGSGSTMSTRSTYAEISANGVLTLIAVASSLLARQIATLETSFLEEGGFTEKLYRARSAARNSAKSNVKGGPLR